MSLKEFENLGRDLRDTVLRLMRDYAEALTLALVMALVLRLFIFSAYKISNVTMEPSLKLGDFVVGYKLPYGISVPFSGVKLGASRPRRGDVVVFRCPDAPSTGCVKRVVGVAGDRIQIKKQRLWINGRQAEYSRAPDEVDFYSRKLRVVSLRERWGDLDWTILVSDAETKQDFGPYVVPPDQFFVLADNRDMGLDSRHWGALPNSHIEARLFFIWLSVRWAKGADAGLKPSLRFDRIFRPVH